MTRFSNYPNVIKEDNIIYKKKFYDDNFNKTIKYYEIRVVLVEH